MKTLLWFIYFFVSLICLIPYQAYVALLKKTGKEEKAQAKVNDIVRWWMGSLLRLAGVTADVQGAQYLPEGPAVFICNHQGYFDIPLLLVHLNAAHGFVAKQEIKRIPLLGQWMRWIHCIYLDRASGASGIATMNIAVQQLKRGHSLIIFPEGTRSRGGPIKEFKAGATSIAKRAGVPIVPICINGSYKAMEANGMKIKKAHCDLVVLPAVDVTDMGREEFRNLHTQLQKGIEGTLNVLQGSAEQGEEAKQDSANLPQQ
ncbi:1-acyl-sn-glycerol-3-phosphate acyltransferase [Ruminococcaceae bacterium OttesenSCG-928-N02]|nr:1-acyl-sn-glycerol-3-phosphate acyltransferase [Ruminococcaceae bacterium OttesenSCG-928-N02]